MGRRDQGGPDGLEYLIEGFADHFTPASDRAIGVVSSVYAQFVGGSQPVGYHVVKAGLNEMVRYYAATPMARSLAGVK